MSAIDERNRHLFAEIKNKIGIILAEQILKYNDGKFHAHIELNPATHALTEFVFHAISEEQRRAQFWEDEHAHLEEKLKNQFNSK